MAIPEVEILNLEILGVRTVGSSGAQGQLKVVKLCSLFRHFYSKMYRLATTHSVTDGQTDRQTDGGHYCVNSRSYCVQYHRLKQSVVNHDSFKILSSLFIVFF